MSKKMIWKRSKRETELYKNFYVNALHPFPQTAFVIYMREIPVCYTFDRVNTVPNDTFYRGKAISSNTFYILGIDYK
jgi:hypothetical protein